MALVALSLMPRSADAGERTDPRGPYRFFLNGELLETEDVSMGPVEDLDTGSPILVDHRLMSLGPGREFHFVRAPNGLQLEARRISAMGRGLGFQD